MRRTRHEVTRDILNCIKDRPRKKTHVMYRANLSHALMKDYFKLFEKQGFIKIGEKISITKKGKDFADELEKALRELEVLNGKK